MSNFEFAPITEEIVLRNLRAVKTHTATADLITSNRVLRECAPFISSSLSYIFNLSVSTATFPDSWKQATVVPIYKRKGSARTLTNYRPVSLLPAVAKLLDSILSKRLLSYLVKSNLISCKQFGFLPRRSTSMQLALVVDKWLKSFDSGQASVAVFMDFQKAFDRVWHHGLLYKLAAMGVGKYSLTWLRSYLTSREIVVRVGTARSDPYTLRTGVPQGSHLGPVLFLVFINDLPQTVDLPTELYADDALIHKCNFNLTDNSIRSLQDAVDSAAEWATSWHGRFGSDKTKALPLTRGSHLSTELIGKLTILGQTIEVTRLHKHLGLLISGNLDWTDHVKSVIATGSRRAGHLRWMSQDLPPEIVQSLYIYYVRPTMEYAAPIWHSSIREEEASALERIQAGVARSILRAPWRTPKSSLLKELGWPALRWRRMIASLCLLHKFVYDWSTNEDETLLRFSKRRSRKPMQIILNHSRTRRYNKSFFFYTSVLWNTLPNEIQAIKNPISFKKCINDHFGRHKYVTDKNISIPGFI